MVSITDGVVRDQALRLADLALVEPRVHRMKFENCLILGPAVVVLMGETVIDGCRFDGPPEMLLWDFPENVEKVGAIGLDSCEFRGCAFQAVGFAGPPQFHELFSAGMQAAPVNE